MFCKGKKMLKAKITKEKYILFGTAVSFVFPFFSVVLKIIETPKRKRTFKLKKKKKAKINLRQHF